MRHRLAQSEFVFIVPELNVFITAMLLYAFAPVSQLTYTVRSERLFQEIMLQAHAVLTRLIVPFMSSGQSVFSMTTANYKLQ